MAAGGGGAGKVAYADFVTARMALFLVLWIINQDEKIKGDVSAHFKTRFKSITKQSVGIIPIENADLIKSKRAHFDNQSAIPLDHVRRLNQDLVVAFIQNPNFIDMKTLRVNMTDEGLLLEFFNDPNRRLFDPGRAEMTSYGKLLFGIVAWTLAKHTDTLTTTSIEVEGHTGRNFKAKTDDTDDDHWSISTKRALVVRKHMEDEGVKEAQFHKMVGFGATRPLKDQPKPDHPYHNRVSIMVRAGQSQ